MKDSKGFTLIELLLVLALVGLVLSLALTLYNFGNSSFDREYEKSNAVANARFTMDYLTREIRKATVVEVDGSILTIDSSEIKREGRTLYKDGEAIASGIDNLLFSMNGNEVKIEIVIILKNSKEYRLSSNVYIR